MVKYSRRLWRRCASGRSGCCLQTGWEDLPSLASTRRAGRRKPVGRPTPGTRGSSTEPGVLGVGRSKGCRPRAARTTVAGAFVGRRGQAQHSRWRALDIGGASTLRTASKFHWIPVPNGLRLSRPRGGVTTVECVLGIVAEVHGWCSEASPRHRRHNLPKGDLCVVSACPVEITGAPRVVAPTSATVMVCPASYGICSSPRFTGAARRSCARRRRPAPRALLCPHSTANGFDWSSSGRIRVLAWPGRLYCRPATQTQSQREVNYNPERK